MTRQEKSDNTLSGNLPLSIGTNLGYQVAVEETAGSNYEFIEPEHLFIGVCKLEIFLLPDILKKVNLPRKYIPILKSEVEQLLSLFQEFNLDPTQVRRSMRKRLGDGSYNRTNEQGTIHRSHQSRAVFRRAEEIAREKSAAIVAVQYLLASLLEIEGSKISDLLDKLEIDPEVLLKAALELPVELDGQGSATPYLDKYGVDLTQKARQGESHETIGRKQEMLQVIRILARERKNNPLLVGEAGVGKTAIIEGLAYRIAHKNIPQDFHHKRIIQINVGDLVSGRKHRGDFEERMQGIIADAIETDEIILFIDEIHLLVGAGSAGGSMDAANLFKTALARSNLKLIGATTPKEYRQYIEKDSALERRFMRIEINEPTAAETFDILEGMRPHLQVHHNNVTILDEALSAAIKLSMRYLPDLRLPDKARDLIDAAASRVRFGNISYHPNTKEIENITNTVTAETIREVLAEKTGIPLAQLEEEEAQRIQKMAEILGEKIIGQDQAIQAVVEVIKTHYAGLHLPNRPVAVFLLVGPTGVGKTELAKQTAEFLFGSQDRIIRLNMKEFREKHYASRMIGATPEFVGHEQGGQLTEALHKMPYAVVLFDEIEKAHPEVLNVFLQIFEEGSITDGQGRIIDAQNAIFMSTSNLGYQPKSGHSKTKISREDIQNAIEGHFRPEFLNRIDDIIFFEKLKSIDMPKIVDVHLSKLKELLEEKEITLEVEKDVIQWLADHGYDDTLGARPLIRLINKEIRGPIGNLMLSGELKSTKMIKVTMKDDMIDVDIADLLDLKTQL